MVRAANVLQVQLKEKFDIWEKNALLRFLANSLLKTRYLCHTYTQTGAR